VGRLKSLVTLVMEAICSSETLVLLTRATRRHIAENSIVNSYYREKLSQNAVFEPTTMEDVQEKGKVVSVLN
jgi:hypothetical protein